MLETAPQHFATSSSPERAVTLLRSFPFLAAKARLLGPQPLLADFELVRRSGRTDTTELEPYEEAVALAADALAIDGAQLAGQFAGRLRDASVLAEIEATAQGPWLRPLVHALARSGGALRRTITLHPRAEPVVLSADGRRAVCGHADASVRVWDLTDGTELRTLAVGKSGFDDFHAIALLDGDTRAIVAESTRTPDRWRADRWTLWDLDDVDAAGVELALTDSYADELVPSPDGRHLVVVAGSDAQIWSLEPFALLRSVRAPEDPGAGTDRVRSAAVTPDGRRLVLLTWPGVPHVYDLATGRHERALVPRGVPRLRAGVVAFVRAWPRGSALGRLRSGRDGARFVWRGELRGLRRVRAAVAGFWDSWRLASYLGLTASVRVARRKAAEAWRDFPQEFRATTSSRTAFSPDGRLLAAPGRGKSLDVWDIARGRRRARIDTAEFTAGVVAPSFTPDGERIVAGGFGGELAVWRWRSGQRETLLSAHDHGIESLVLVEDAGVVTASRSSVRLWRLGRDTDTQSTRGPGASTLALLPDGRRAVTATEGQLQILDLETGRALSAFDAQTNGIGRLAALPDGRRVVATANQGSDTAFPEGAVCVWDIETGERLGLYPESRSTSLEGLVVSPDGRIAVTPFHIDDLQDHVYGVVIWDIDSGATLGQAFEERNPFFSRDLAFAADGRHVVSAELSDIHVWRAPECELVGTFTAHEARVCGVAVGETAGSAVSIDEAGVVRIWDVATRTETDTWTLGTALRRLSVTPDLRRAAVVEEDRTILLVDLQRHQRLATFTLDSAVGFCRLSRDGRRIVANDQLGALHLLAVGGLS